MPTAPSLQENYELLWTVLTCSEVNIDWDEVAKMSGISRSAVTRRYAKVMKSMNAGDSGPKLQPKRQKRANQEEVGGEPTPKKRKAKDVAEMGIKEEEDRSAAADDEMGEEWI